MRVLDDIAEFIRIALIVVLLLLIKPSKVVAPIRPYSPSDTQDERYKVKLITLKIIITTHIIQQEGRNQIMNQKDLVKDSDEN